MEEFQFIRSGDEPLHARSPLRLRMGLIAFSLATSVAGLVLFAVLGIMPLVIFFAVLLAVGLVNSAVVIRRIRQGPHFQPGPEVPPYRPAQQSKAGQTTRPPTASPVRHARYAVLAGVTILLIANAWTWVRTYSVGWAVGLSVLAALLLLAGVVASNAESPILRRGHEGREAHAQTEADRRTGTRR